MQEDRWARGPETLPDYYDELDGSLDQAWAYLRQGVRDRTSLFHTPVFATVDEDGAPQVRTVVLRDTSRENAILRFHSDWRSGKLEHLKRDARCGVHAYDPVAKIQLRLGGTASVHHEDDIAEAAWQGSREMSRLCYTQGQAPGAVLHGPRDATSDDAPDLVAGRPNFCVVLMSVIRIEWLYLSHLGHRRAAWTRSDGAWSGTWLAP